jgi:hypothetical protein
VYGDRDVAVKALQPHRFDLQEMKHVRHHSPTIVIAGIEELSLSYAEVLQGGNNLEMSSSSERVAAAGGDRDGRPVRHGF